jgi:hypothetical protein
VSAQGVLLERSANVWGLGHAAGAGFAFEIVRGNVNHARD